MYSIRTIHNHRTQEFSKEKNARPNFSLLLSVLHGVNQVATTNLHIAGHLARSVILSNKKKNVNSYTAEYLDK